MGYPQFEDEIIAGVETHEGYKQNPQWLSHAFILSAWMDSNQGMMDS
jgi:hypothetical protein